MLKSIYEGYLPTMIIAVLGFNTLGGSVLTWSAFVWVFGAVLTVLVAFYRARNELDTIPTRGVAARMENC